MEQPSSDEDLVKGRYWRKIDKIIIHNKFINEARSWKGFDYALLKLSSEHGKGGSPPEGNVMPVCFPLPNFWLTCGKHFFHNKLKKAGVNAMLQCTMGYLVYSRGG